MPKRQNLDWMLVEQSGQSRRFSISELNKYFYDYYFYFFDAVQLIYYCRDFCFWKCWVLEISSSSAYSQFLLTKMLSRLRYLSPLDGCETAATSINVCDKLFSTSIFIWLHKCQQKTSSVLQMCLGLNDYRLHNVQHQISSSTEAKLHRLRKRRTSFLLNIFPCISSKN